MTCPVMPKSSGDRRDADVLTYGGRKSINTAYCCIIRAKFKKTERLEIATIPIYMAERIKNRDELQKYLETKYENPVILRERLMLHSIIELDGILYQIRSVKSNGEIRLVLAEPFLMPGAERYELIFRAAGMKNERRFASFAKENGINAEVNLKLYDDFVQAYETKYALRKNNAVDKLKTGRENFKKLDLSKQCKVITNLFGLSACISTSHADLSLLGDITGAGAMSIKMNKASSLTVVEYSATGLYERRTTY